METTVCRNYIWDVKFLAADGKIITLYYAASNLTDLLSYFSEGGKNRILQVERTKMEVSYRQNYISKTTG